MKIWIPAARGAAGASEALLPAPLPPPLARALWPPSPPPLLPPSTTSRRPASCPGVSRAGGSSWEEEDEAPIRYPFLYGPQLSGLPHLSRF